MLIIELCKIVLSLVLLLKKRHHLVESSAYNSHVEFSKKEANVISHHLINAAMNRASTQVYFDIPSYIDYPNLK